MILTAIDSLLLLYITAGLGILMLALLQKIFRQPVEANILGVVLAGLMSSTVYFNLVSFWLPVNYVTLIPLFALSSFIFLKNKKGTAQFLSSIKKRARFIFARANLWFTIPVLALLFAYWIVPPINIDSSGYHYATIEWYEKYKAVPGLANVHGRYAFNAAAFIIQSAYSFTGLTGQALYPLNGVITALFLLWLLTRVLKNKNTALGFAYYLLFFFLGRITLLNISSPSSDALVIICLSYAIIKYFDVLIAKNISVQFILLPFLLVLYAVVAKLSAFPALLTIPFILYLLKKQERIFPFVIRVCIICLPLYVTWFCRNIILSGYLVYPLPYIDIFNFDWKAPKDVLMMDYINIQNAPKLLINNVSLKTNPFPGWVLPWLAARAKKDYFADVLFLLMALSSPLYWIIIYIKRKKISAPVFVLWLLVYAAVWMWFINSPEFRFGAIFISFAIMLPFLFLAVTGLQKSYSFMRIALIGILLVSVTYYTRKVFTQDTTYAFSLKDCWLYPLKDKHYYLHNNKADFKYVLLNTGVKLYMADSVHDCLNVAQPCMVWDYGTIEMRGNKMQDGFRNVKDEVGKNYPYVR